MADRANYNFQIGDTIQSREEYLQHQKHLDFSFISKLQSQEELGSTRKTTEVPMNCCPYFAISGGFICFGFNYFLCLSVFLDPSSYSRTLLSRECHLGQICLLCKDTELPTPACCRNHSSVRVIC